MSFRETLKGVVENVEGGLGAVIMGYDGIAIEEYIKEGTIFDVQLLSVEYASLLKEIRRTVEVLKAGEIEETSILTEISSAVMRIINEDFFIVLFLHRSGNFGKGRYLLKRAAPMLREELQ